jgi:hypothetical protein
VRADPRSHRDRLPARDPLDVHTVGAVAHRELDVLMGGFVQVLHVRQRDVPQPDSARAQRRELDHPQPDPVLPVRAAL